MNPYGVQPAAQAASGPSGASGRRLPAKGTLEYVKLTVEVLLLLLAIPWIMRELVRSPGRASRRAAAKHLAGS